ncbi:MAG TPA: hypothetical protein VGI19_00720 [Candidatus Cybelea sp.]
MSLQTHKFIDWKQMLATLPLAAAILLNGCGDRLGNGAPPGTEASTNVPSALNRSVTKIMSLQIVRTVSDTKSVKIFDNLAQLPSGKYWGGVQTVIAGGSGNKTFYDNQIAAAFTPSADSTATVVEVPAVQVSFPGYGSSGFELSVNRDDNGVPGKALITAQLPALVSGSPLCCGLIVGKIPSGLALSGGQQYWIVLNGQGGQSNDLAGWTVNAVDQLHPFLDAVYCAYASKCTKGVGWYPYQQSFGFGTGLAFAVLGSN